jgi:preprotein translocase subunit YajC
MLKFLTWILIIFILFYFILLEAQQQTDQQPIATNVVCVSVNSHIYDV